MPDQVSYSLAASVVALCIIGLSAKFSGVAGALCAAFCCFVLSLFSMSPAVIHQSLFTLIAAFVCVAVKSRPRTVFAAAAVIAVVCHGLAALLYHSETARLTALRDRFPMQSLADRLSYEQPVAVDAGVKTFEWRDGRHQTRNSPEVNVSTDVQDRLSERDREHNGHTSRSWALERLHDQKSIEFMAAMGFGVMRMTIVREERVTLPEVESPPQPSSAPAEVEYSPQGRASDAVHQGPHPPWYPQRTGLLRAHDAAIADFLDEDRMGYVASRESVAGFVAHRFTKVPPLSSIAGLTSDGVDWRVARLELVSILRHQPAAVYVSDKLPNMDALREAPVRALDPFEVEALPKLRTEDDLVVREAHNSIRMLGSLRATTGCLQCHNAAHGQLLGALSYELRRDPPVAEPPAAKPAPDLQSRGLRSDRKILAALQARPPAQVRRRRKVDSQPHGVRL